MKVLILSVADRRHMTMVSLYEEYFNKNNIPYDIIRMNRYDQTNDVKHYKDGLAEIYEFPFVESTKNSKLSKVFPFLRFKGFAKKLILKNKYDYIVVWNENTALLFIDVLLKYKNNYCFNIRDVPEIPFTRKIYNLLINRSFFSTIPTPAKIFQNDKKIIILYNRDINILNNVSKKTGFKSKKQILNITFMGRYSAAPNTFMAISKIFANDDRFRLYFYGDGFDTELKEYLRIGNINNIFVGGAFTYEKTFEYLSNTDIIDSYYDDSATNISRRFSAGVKVSYTPLLYIPAFTDDNTSWAEICKEFGFSFVVSNNNIVDLPNRLFNWYHSLDFNDFKYNCDRFNKVIDSSRAKVFDLLNNKLLNEIRRYNY